MQGSNVFCWQNHYLSMLSIGILLNTNLGPPVMSVLKIKRATNLQTTKSKSGGGKVQSAINNSEKKSQGGS